MSKIRNIVINNINNIPIIKYLIDYEAALESTKFYENEFYNHLNICVNNSGRITIT